MLWKSLLIIYRLIGILYNLIIYSISVIFKLNLSSKTFFLAIYSFVLNPFTSIISELPFLWKTIKSALYFKLGAKIKVGWIQKPSISFAFNFNFNSQ